MYIAMNASKIMYVMHNNYVRNGRKYTSLIDRLIDKTVTSFQTQTRQLWSYIGHVGTKVPKRKVVR